MKFDLNRLDREPVDFDSIIESEQIEAELAGVTFSEGLRVAGTVARQSGRIEVKGEIRGTALLDCTRCLETINERLVIPVEAAFVPAEEFATESESEISGDDLKIDVLEGDSLDLAQLVREQVLLALPTQVLCNANCKGLCEQCGTNLNRETCKCGEDDIDPRWAALKNLK
jgi:uncharacterized protein